MLRGSGGSCEPCTSNSAGSEQRAPEPRGGLFGLASAFVSHFSGSFFPGMIPRPGFCRTHKPMLQPEALLLFPFLHKKQDKG